MKKLIIFISLIFPLIATSQDIIDPPTLPINFNDTTVFDRNWDQNHFIKGWNWGSQVIVIKRI